mmetsp:Transcript_5152/g.16098  ORF Transcript_5152/g.16098 Transcript_5152/m.16098 type:complete len:255 (-) Transcript_5152:18-782(-)
MHLRHRLLSKDLGGPEAEVPQHVRGELLARDPAAGRAHGPLQEALDLRHGAEVEGRVAPVVLGEDVHALRHEALGALQGAARRGLVQRGVADGVFLVVREALRGRHEEPQDLQVALEGGPVQRAVLLPLDLALRLIVVLVNVCGVVLDQEPRQRLVAVGGGPDERAPLPAVLAAGVRGLLDQPHGLLRAVALAGLQQLGVERLVLLRAILAVLQLIVALLLGAHGRHAQTGTRLTAPLATRGGGATEAMLGHWA